MAQTTLKQRQIAGGLDGWIPAEETWTYASADDPTFTFTVAADVTGKYRVGMKLKLTQLLGYSNNANTTLINRGSTISPTTIAAECAYL